MKEIAAGVSWLPITIANVYFVGETGENWVLVDAGTPGAAQKIRLAAEARYGPGARPQAILLTHGHFDHTGSALALARMWDVPIYIHPRELPFVTGESVYPPSDPTIGGAMAFLTRFFPQRTINLADRVQVLPYDGVVPHLQNWKWLETPGHAPGHVSYYRESDGTLLAGDAFTTIDVDSLIGLLTLKQIIARPPSPVTCDWDAARRSVEMLADLEPVTIACGHGIPMSGADVAARLHAFSDYFPMPSHGRYIPHPAITDAEGIAGLPPRPEDPLGKAMLAAGAALASGLICVAIASVLRNSTLR